MRLEIAAQSKRPCLPLIGRGSLTCLAFVAVAGCASSSPGTVPEDAIVVGTPKVYDDHYLQSQLDATKARLGALQFLDQSAIVSRYGSYLGATLAQTGFQIQGLGVGMPEVTTVLPSVAGTAGSGSFTQTTKQGGLNPSAVNPPQTPPQFPTSPSAASLDILNEQMQLTFQAANWQLLLDGALSDRYQLKGGGKRRITIGIPVTISQPDLNLADHIAEIEVTICASADNDAGIESPSIVTLLPLENTYNGLSITDDEKQIQFGAIAGIFSINAGFLNANKAYYLVKHQDVVALQREPWLGASCGYRRLGKEEANAVPPNAGIVDIDPARKDALPKPEEQALEVLYRDQAGALYRRVPMVTFAWQLRPPLGGHYVKSGIRQNFVQLALPNPKTLCSGRVFIRTRWLTEDPRTGAITLTDWSSAKPKLISDLYKYDTTPYSFNVSADDLGGGTVAVKATGTFLPGLRVRIGGALVDASSPTFHADTERIQFTTSAQSLIANKVFLVGGDEQDHELQFWPPGTNPYEPLGCKPPSSIPSFGDRLLDLMAAYAVEAERRVEEDLRKTNEAKSKPQDDETPPQVIHVDERKVEIEPYSDSSSLITIETTVKPGDQAKLDALRQKGQFLPRDEYKFPLVAMVGGKVFGLSDAPFFYRSSDGRTLQVVVGNDAIATSPSVIVERLMMGPAYSSGWVSITPKAIRVSKVLTISSDDKVVTLAVMGSGLGNVCLVSPVGLGAESDCDLTSAGSARQDAPSLRRVDRTLAIVTLPRSVADNTKQLVLSNTFNYRAIVAMPGDGKQATASSSTASFEPASLKVGATQAILKGKNLGKIIALKSMGQVLNFVVNAAGAIVVDLPASFSASVGVHYLEYVTTDKSLGNVLITVAKEG